MSNEQINLEAKLRLVELEAIIDRNYQPETFIEVGTALKEIRDSKLYQVTHKTFEAYCHAKWKMTRRRAYQYIDSAQTVKEMCTRVHIAPPATEGVARQLKGTPEEKAADWEATHERHGPNPTVAQTREVVEERRPRAKPRPKQRDDSGDSISQNPEVWSWVDKRRRKGRTRDEIRQDSVDGVDGWPLGDKAYLGQNATGVCLGILEALRRQAENPSAPSPARPAKSGAKRVRQIGPRPHSPLVDVSHKIAQLTSILETIDIDREILDEEGAVVRLLRDLDDDLFRLEVWMEVTKQALRHRLGKDDLIVKRKKMAETKGRTPAEIDVIKRNLAKLDRRIDEADSLAAGG